MTSRAGNNFPGIVSQFAMHFWMTATQNIFCVEFFLLLIIINDMAISWSARVAKS